MIYRKGRTDLVTGAFIPGRSYWDDITRYLRRWGMRILNDLQANDLGTPSHEQLEDLFYSRVLERGVTHHPYDGHGVRGSIEVDKVAEMADYIAQAILDQWDSDFIREKQFQGMIGGKKGRPRGATKTTDDHYFKFLDLPPGMTRSEQAQELGIGLRSVDRLRARRSADPNFQVGPFDEE